MAFFSYIGAKLVPMTKNVVLTPPDYDRDIRHYEFDLSGTGFTYRYKKYFKLFFI
jgi:sulfite reductase alpha subunit-like flavoprotein